MTRAVSLQTCDQIFILIEAWNAPGFELHHLGFSTDYRNRRDAAIFYGTFTTSPIIQKRELLGAEFIAAFGTVGCNELPELVLNFDYQPTFVPQLAVFKNGRAASVCSMCDSGIVVDELDWNVLVSMCITSDTVTSWNVDISRQVKKSNEVPPRYPCCSLYPALTRKIFRTIEVFCHFLACRPLYEVEFVKLTKLIPLQTCRTLQIAHKI